MWRYTNLHANDKKCVSAEGGTVPSDAYSFVGDYIAFGTIAPPPPPAPGSVFTCTIAFTGVSPYLAYGGELYPNAAGVVAGVNASTLKTVVIPTVQCTNKQVVLETNTSCSNCSGTVVQYNASLVCTACPGAVALSGGAFSCSNATASSLLTNSSSSLNFSYVAFGNSEFNCSASNSTAGACALRTLAPAEPLCSSLLCNTSSLFHSAALCGAACGNSSVTSSANSSLCSSVCGASGPGASLGLPGSVVCAPAAAGAAESLSVNLTACGSGIACAAGTCSFSCPAVTGSVVPVSSDAALCSAGCGVAGSPCVCSSPNLTYTSALFYSRPLCGSAVTTTTCAAITAPVTLSLPTCNVTLPNGTFIEMTNVTSCGYVAPPPVQCPYGYAPANNSAEFVSMVAYHGNGSSAVRTPPRYVRSNLTSLTGGTGIATTFLLVVTYSKGTLVSMDWSDLGCGSCGGTNSPSCLYTGVNSKGSAQHQCATLPAVCFAYSETEAVLNTSSGVTKNGTVNSPCALSLFVGAAGTDMHGRPMHTGGQLSLLQRYSVTALASSAFSIAKSYYSSVAASVPTGPSASTATISGRR